MYDNVGQKMKVAASVLCWVGVIGSLIIAFYVGKMDETKGMIIFFIGAIVSWLSNLVLYGLGELIIYVKGIYLTLNDDTPRVNPFAPRYVDEDDQSE